MFHEYNAFLVDHPKKPRDREYLNRNFENCDTWAIKCFRNATMHLSAIRNAYKYINDIVKFSSYFELYHYLMQRVIMDQYEFDSTHFSKKQPDQTIISEDRLNLKTPEFFRLVQKYHGYSKDFVKTLNVSFSFNLPRYKNLLIRELFDRNNFLQTKKDDIAPDNE